MMYVPASGGSATTAAERGPGSASIPLPPPPPEFLTLFRQSMPASYLRTYDDASVGEHAGIVWRRGSSLVHVELWRRISDAAAIVCIAADDRPGLLSLVTAAIGAHAFETLDAKTYCRPRAGLADEAVDLFLIRRLGSGAATGPIGKRELGSLRRFLVALLRSEIDVRSAMRRIASAPRLRPPASAHVAFDVEGALVVESDDRPGLLLTISSVLSDVRARIVESEITTVDGRARDHFRLVEQDGSPLTESRRKQIAFSVLLGIERLESRAP